MHVKRNHKTIQWLLNAENNFDPGDYAAERASLFFFAALVGDLSLIQLLLASYPELLRVTDAYNQTGLLWAAAYGQQEVLEFFITAGVSINQPTRHSSGNANNATPLDWAIKNGHRTAFLTLWNTGAKANLRHTRIQGKGFDRLIAEGALAHVQTLITYNPVLLNQIDRHGFAPLHYAVLHKEKAIVQWLVAEGANISLVSQATPELCRRMGYFNREAWIIAIYGGAFDIAGLMLASIADGPFHGNKAMAILSAAENGLIPLVQRLLTENAALINVYDDCAQTPLLLAARKGYHELVSFLIGKGANVNLPTRLPRTGYYPEQEENNYTPLDWAIKEGHIETIIVLKNAGAIQNQTTTVCENNTLSNHLTLSLFSPVASSSIDEVPVVDPNSLPK